MKKQYWPEIILFFVLGLITNIIFDILPNFLDLPNFLKLSFSKYLLVVVLFIIIWVLTMVIRNYMQKVSWNNKILVGQIALALDKIVTDESSSIPSRLPFIPPATPQIRLSCIFDVKKSLSNHGYFEFMVESNPNFLNTDHSIYLHSVSPGMSKFFMVLIQDHNPDRFPNFLRIDSGYEEPREFTETWFNYIFPILGNHSQYISVKLSGNQLWEISEEFFVISKYKIIKRKRCYRIRILIY